MRRMRRPIFIPSTLSGGCARNHPGDKKSRPASCPRQYRADRARRSEMSTPPPVRLTVNGVERDLVVEPRLLLVHALRDNLGLTGTHVGCDTSNCGACTIHLDGASVKSCTVLAVQADGGAITTSEGMAT